MYCFICTYELDNPELFMEVYIEDVIPTIKSIVAKTKERGYENRDA